MSALGGVAWTDPRGRPDDAALARLADALARFGPDGGRARRAGSAALVHRALHVTPGSRGTPQPLRSPQGAWICFDGRLDNRADLSDALDLDRGGSDALLVAHAFDRWGDASPARLLGDFALAAWDETAGRLLLARDPLGVRPLFFHRAGAALWWSSSLEALIAAAKLSTDVDEEWVGGYFIQWTPPERTPFAAIRALPAGHTLVWDGGQTWQRPYWSLDPGTPIERADDAEFEERFRALFREIVGCRLRTDGPVGADLSGGLDTSTIVCQAAALIDAGRVAARELVTISQVYDEAQTCDERRFIRPIEQHVGRRGLHVSDADCPVYARAGEPCAEYPTALASTLARDAMAVRHVRAAGARTHLTGVGGDGLLWSEMAEPVDLLDLLRARRFSDLRASLRRWNEALELPYARLLFDGLVRPLLPAALQRASQRRAAHVPAWVAPAFARRLDLAGRNQMSRAGGGFRHASQREIHDQVQDAARELTWRYDRGGPVLDFCFPLLDTRLVQFALRLPFEQFVRGTQTRSLQRRALRGLVPDVVLSRTTKGSMMEAAMRGLARHAPAIERLCERPFSARLGLIDAAVLRDMLRRARFGVPPNRRGPGVAGGTVGLAHALGLEFWLRMLETRRSGDWIPREESAAPTEGLDRPIAVPAAS